MWIRVRCLVSLYNYLRPWCFELPAGERGKIAAQLIRGFTEEEFAAWLTFSVVPSLSLMNKTDESVDTLLSIALREAKFRLTLHASEAHEVLLYNPQLPAFGAAWIRAPLAQEGNSFRNKLQRLMLPRNGTACWELFLRGDSLIVPVSQMAGLVSRQCCMAKCVLEDLKAECGSCWSIVVVL